MGKAMRIKKDDQVVVIGGKDAGKAGRVIRTEPKKNRVYVEGLNILKRNERARGDRQMGQKVGAGDQGRGATGGGIVHVEGPIHISNVMLVDPKDNKRTRVGMRRDKGGKRERFAKRTGAAL